MAISRNTRETVELHEGDRSRARAKALFFLRALKIHQRRETLAALPRYQDRLDIKKRLRKALESIPEQDDGVRVHKRYTDI
ncbi:MAG: hypothetical protein AAFU53_08890 [Cyanobacteria bacterium J06632_3]